jgi:hypothetical protein
MMTSYKAKLDGTPAPLTGSPVADMVSVKKVDEQTREMKSRLRLFTRSSKHASQEVALV